MGLEPGSPGWSSFSRKSSASAKRVYIAPSLVYEDPEDPMPTIATIPERDRRLISALMLKRRRDREHADLADRFHQLWSQEKEERELLESQTTASYERYISGKRQSERRRRDELRLRTALEQHARRGRLLDAIAAKELRAAETLACTDDRKHTDLVQRSSEHQTREALAAWRRTLDAEAAEERRLLALTHALEREDQAGRRRQEKLVEMSQKVSITNALSSWGSAHVRQRRRDLDAFKLASTAARVAVTDAKATRVLMAKTRRQERARKVADYTALLRESIKEERWSAADCL